jgi:hypothetical protein
MLEALRDDAANGDFYNKVSFRVAVIPGVTGVSCRLESAVSISIEKSIVLLTGAVDALGSAEVLLADLATAQ